VQCTPYLSNYSVKRGRIPAALRSTRASADSSFVVLRTPPLGVLWTYGVLRRMDVLRRVTPTSLRRSPIERRRISTDLPSEMPAADSQMTTSFFTLLPVKGREINHSQMTTSFFVLQSWMLDSRFSMLVIARPKGPRQSISRENAPDPLFPPRYIFTCLNSV